MDVHSPAHVEPRNQRALGQRLLTLEPQYRERIWGGRRLRVADAPIGEAWIAMGDSRVAAGPLAGRTVADLAAEFGAELLGRTVFARFGGRFPLLAKFLDSADWLSVQVHPNDEQARRMVGPDEFGKTEAWYFVETQPDARILLGVKPSTSPTALATAIRAGRVTEVAQDVAIRQGDALLIPAGTLHALGPGLLLFEIQQASDATYRAYDWGRPQTAGRKLHIEESVAVMTTDGPPPSMAPRLESGAGTADAVHCRYFDLDLVRAAREPLHLDTGARSFHILAAIDGTAEVTTGSERVRLDRFETLLVAGSAGAYEVAVPEGGTSATLLRVAVPS